MMKAAVVVLALALALTADVPAGAAPLLSSSSDLPPQMANHSFLFVVGAHHSGTTILDLVICQHPSVSCLLDTNVPENEGQHLQHVYPSAARTGGDLGYGFDPRSRVTEESDFVTDDNRLAIFNAWAKFWDLRKPVLLEKSPPHMLKMRFLQALFTGDRVSFLMTIRHPLGCAHFRYMRPQYREEGVPDCGEEFIAHWLQLYRLAREDMEHIEHVAVIQLEDFVGRSQAMAQGYMAEMERFLGLPNKVHLQGKQSHPRPAVAAAAARRGRTRRNSPGGSDPSASAAGHLQSRSASQSPNSHPQADQLRPQSQRKLLGYHGDRHHVQVSFGSAMRWVDDWNALVDMSSPTCQNLIAKYEDELNQYGYSLRNLSHVTQPKVLREHLLKFEVIEDQED
ncbi:hypothetical protein PTSG_10575 [Salpingoeca rosetta]|uniref:Protein-tyrosine sulfotransferase n=1 Tax=Salpingoeca rosetta (strain ATCC 50818 / BSB-021) TaxID=946362 RepID=F2URR5_SALR5|nr:uncharacterized protein PTSG_10575 [Salpingoeca rosetta]EGD80320.1 hypothetical protein PTSG_10575 [Salpingoeca rosetta]|eukprot:XP_004988110.1 hypothetical protein PTSG_10575 [Salpingoeca rosetta]